MMEQNSSNVCVATIHSDEQLKSGRLSNDDAMPLYATIIPSNTRKARLQQEQAAKQTQQSHQPVCGHKTLPIASEHRISKVDDNGRDDNDYESASGESDNETVELWSHELPVWIKGEQRWISGVTDQTTCLDLIEALLIDEGVIKASDDSNNNSGTNLYPTKVNEYVIAERWRRVEQVLDPRTKILKIWAAWGEEQSEVKFTLKRRSDSHHLTTTTSHQQTPSQAQTAGDRDSGRGSPTGSINSAIVRRRRHRASRTTFAWMTHGQTIHPKSQKNSIERLMKLILEQGEVIQLQLAKLRDRELEISTIEEERHKVREKEHGKNYLLETYLKGLGDSEDKQESGAGNSDSGVHTEETAASPVVQHHEDEISDTLLPLNDAVLSSFKAGSKKRRSKREHELLLEHQSTKEYSSAIKDGKKLDEAGTSSNKESIDSEVAAQIDILEKLIVLNKHLQREEELCVRLSAKIKRYEADASGLSEAQVKDSLSRVNEQLDTKNYEIAKMETEIKTSDEALNAKTDFLKQLYDELEEAEVEQRKSEASAIPDVISTSVQLPPLPTSDKISKPLEEDLSMSREYLAENIYNISKMILKNNGPPLTMQSMTQQTSADYIRHTPDSANDVQPMPMLNQQIYQMPIGSTEKRIIQAQIHTIPTSAQQSILKHEHSQSFTSETLPPPALSQQWEQCVKYNDAMRVSMNYLATINQRIQKSNHIETDINNANNPIMQATQYKLGPKKLLINTQVINSNLNSVNESRSSNIIYKHSSILQPNDSNYGVDLAAGDASQLGTLV